jgi:Fe-S-cluster containining protein
MSWTRHGECNGCGFCCQTFTRQAIVRNPDEVDDLAFYQARGFTETTVDGRRCLVLLGWMTAPCPQHVESSCRIYADRPRTCREFPAQPSDIVGTPCSYWFTHGDLTAGGLGSPHPTSSEQLLAMEAGQ